MRSRVLTMLILTTLSVSLLGCSLGKTNSEGIDQNDVFYPIYRATSTDEIEVFVDPNTGVNYLIYDGNYGGGMTLRINADSTPYVTSLDTESEE